MTAPDVPPPTYVDLDLLDPCELPSLLIVNPDTGKRQVPTPGQAWECVHGTRWVAVPVGLRSGQPTMVWIIQPPPAATT